MGFKELFLVSPEGSTPPPPPPKQVMAKPVVKAGNTFPSSPSFNNDGPTFPHSTPDYVAPTEVNYTTKSVANPFLEKILDVYERGFEKLNMTGYDFFEYFKAVLKAGVNNPQVYTMAFDMAQSMDANVSKNSLMGQADYYVSELEKVYNDFNNNGRNKIQELTQKKNNESTSLANEISTLQQQVEQMKVQISLKQSALSDIDHRYQPEIDEVSQKLEANDQVKNKFVSNINVVKMNINNNLK
jgi:hypothetical protein